MRLLSRELFEELKKTMNEDEIFKRCEFSKERFFKNLEKEEKGEIDQLVIKQHYRLFEMSLAEIVRNTKGEFGS